MSRITVRVLGKHRSVRRPTNYPGEHRKMVECERVPGKGRICASNEKLFERVPKNGKISVSTEKW